MSNTNIVVRIVKNWEDNWVSDNLFMAQTPHADGLWGRVRFTLDPVEDPDYLIVFNRPRTDIHVRCRASRIWAFIQEPPNEVYRAMHKGQPAFARVYMADESNVGPRYHLSYPAIPWLNGLSYAELNTAGIPEKSGVLSCITTKTVFFSGHRRRLAFLSALRRALPLELYGRGIRDVARKWDAIAPFKYSLVIENTIHPWYWTEKLADCFLAYTFPFYVGCPRIGHYLPKDSFVLLDINRPDDSIEVIREAIGNGLWESRLKAIQEARQLVMSTYNTFPYIAKLIEEHERSGVDTHDPLVPIKVKAMPFCVLHTWARAKFFASVSRILSKVENVPDL